MVKKHDGSWRMCVDFTNLNKACSHDCYPLPKIDWKVESLCGYPFKCFLDAYKGYHQIQMAEMDEEKTAFHTPHGVYCYTKMPFGLKNAGATYQRLVDKAFEKQMESGRAVEGMFLGYMIGSEGIKSCPEKIEAVLQLSSPRTIKEVQSLNGKLVGLNRFLSKSAEKSLALFKTLKKCVKKRFPLDTRSGARFQTTETAYIRTPHVGVTKAKGRANDALQGPELNSTPMEKLVLALVFVVKRIQRPRTSVKGHILEDFLMEKPEEASADTSEKEAPQEP
ncbi:reverse transcriptase domain-containing protein [Tanacetum coccineum]